MSDAELLCIAVCVTSCFPLLYLQFVLFSWFPRTGERVQIGRCWRWVEWKLVTTIARRCSYGLQKLTMFSVYSCLN